MAAAMRYSKSYASHVKKWQASADMLYGKAWASLLYLSDLRCDFLAAGIRTNCT